MIKKIKMLLYGVAGVGKSVFALKFPKPFFITTDGNYQWLGEFGAKETDYKQVNTWKEFLEFTKSNDFLDYETVVIDLVEDLFMWCEKEYCKKNKLEHIGDLNYGKGYSITRDEFFLTISKMIALNKHVVLLSHEFSKEVKDKRGVEKTLYAPSKFLPEKVLDVIGGRLRYVLRAKFEDEIKNNKIIKKRVLSLAGDSCEFSIIRGVNMDELPDTIPLDFNEFVNTLNLELKANENATTRITPLKSTENVAPLNNTSTIKETPPDALNSVKTALKDVKPIIQTPKVDQNAKTGDKPDWFNELVNEKQNQTTEPKASVFEKVQAILKQEETPNINQQEPKQETKQEEKPTPAVESAEEHMKKLREKIAKMQGK